MQGFLDILNTITPTWGIGITSALTVISYVVRFWRMYRSKREISEKIKSAMIDVPMIIAFVLLWITYSATWLFDIPQDVRAPVARLIFLMLSASDLSRNILKGTS